MNEKRRRQWSWALYDWANSAFATTVLAGFFPIFFAKYWATGLTEGERTWWLGWAGSIASVVVMVLAPVLGGVADRRGLKKSFLLVMTLLGAGSTAALFTVGQGNWSIALFLFGAASVGFFAALSFYDSLIVEVAEPGEMDRVSALGYGAGYIGGGVLFALNVFMFQSPSTFGLDDGAEAILYSFLMVGAWWVLFSIPLFRYVPEAADPDAAASDWAQLKETFGKALSMRPVWMFLLAYWLYIDGVDTIVRMAVDYGIKLGFSPGALIKALLLVQFVAFPAAIAFGRLAERFGTKQMIYVALAGYTAITAWAYTLQTEAQFYLMAAAIALVQGGVQSLSRSLYARLIPAGESGQFFGLYNMLGKFAAVFGPVAMGFTAAAFPENQRLSVLSLLPFFLLGGLLLTQVQDPRADSGSG